MKWTKEHTAEVLELYLRERPKALDKGEENVRKLAEKFGTSPGSVALKISNFFSLIRLLKGKIARVCLVLAKWIKKFGSN
jgi:hypothetical protein